MAKYNNMLNPWAILRTVRVLNWHHGYGEVQAIRLDPPRAIIHVPITQNTHRVVIRTFHFRGNSVVFARHQKKVKR